MRKDSRLSFRISSTLSDRIDNAIEKSEGQIRDRSEFGTKALLFYLDYIENTQSEMEIILNSIVTLADYLGIDTQEVNYISQSLEEQTLLPSPVSSKKTIEKHPKFEDLMNIKEKFDSDIQKEISNRLRDATYNEIEKIYTKYKEQYYQEGSSPKSKKQKLETKKQV